jgi:hypothetical protein
MHLFELYLTPSGGKRFQAIVTASSSQSDGSCDACLPFWDGDRDWYSAIVKTLEATSFPPNPEKVFKQPGEQDWMVSAKILSEKRGGFHPNYLEHIGQALYGSLFPSGTVRDAFQLALRMAEAEGELLHLRLKFPERKRSQLADYPWELIHDGQRFLQHQYVHLSRYIAYEGLPPSFPRQEKLRVLLVSSRPTDLAQLPDLEQQALCEGIARAEEIELNQLALPTFKGLSRYLTEQKVPQVLHFDGHGLYGKRCGNEHCGYVNPGVMAESCQKCGQDLPEAKGFLVFQDEWGRADYVSAASLAASCQGIGLVVLSACQSGMALAGESVFNGTAQQLIDGRVPAVVGMQYKVSVKAAGDFVERFYRVLGKGRSLLEATRAGRIAMGVDGNQWYRPVVYLRWGDNHEGQMFSEGPRVDASSSGLGLSLRLEIDRLKEKLKDLEQDYESIAARLRTEISPTTRNALEREIQQVLQHINTTEQELSKLK